MRLRERTWENITAYSFISPFFILFAIFGLYPIIFTFYLSLFKWNGMGDMTYTGLSNFKFVLTDSTFWTSFGNTLLINLMGTVPQLICALLLAVVLNSALLKAKQVFRVIYFLPNITSIVAVTLIFSVLFAREGVATWIATSIFGIDIENISWTAGFWGPKIAIATMVFWRWLGYNMIIYLAGIQSIPGELFEAAKIDGANATVRLTQITLPLMKPFIIFTVLMSTIGGLQLFTEPYVYFSQSGSATTPKTGITMVIYLYSEAFRTHFFGTAAATAVVLFVLTILFSLINTVVTNRLGGSSGGDQ
jgi:cellobiose transport system permease protein